MIFLVFASGMLYAQLPDGSWEDRTPPTIVSREPLVNFLTTRGQDWTLLGLQPVDGQPAYAIERTYEYKATRKTETLWIDSTSLLPLKLTEKYGEAASSETERIYTDFGAPVDIQVPTEAVAPTPTPEPANPLTSDSPQVIAEGLLQTMLASDLEAVGRYFAPDQQPNTWVDALSFEMMGPPPADLDFSTLLAGCQGVEYTVVERQGEWAGVPRAEVVFTFATDCTIWVHFPSYNNRPANQIKIDLEASTGRWYVSDRVWVVEPGG